MNQSFAGVFKSARKAAGLSQRELAAAIPADQSQVSRWESGRSVPDGPEVVERLDDLLNAGGDLRRAYTSHANTQAPVHSGTDVCGDLDAIELVRRVAVSDVGTETLRHLEASFDELAMAYPTTAPYELLPRISEHLSYIHKLLDARATLVERRRLLVVGGWLSLLAATVHIDLNQHGPASAWLRTAASLAQHTDHKEIVAWCYETEAWRTLTGGDHRKARELAHMAQHHAPAGSSAAIQATAQEGRASARLGDADATYRALDRVHTLSSGLPTPDHAEHHYRYDPAKADAYTATTLAWLGDPEAERHAREVIVRFAPHGHASPWPRRYASAHLDLALITSKTGELDEACAAAQTAIATGQVAPSNYWRVREVIESVTARQLPAAAELREAYVAMIHS